MKTFGQAIAIQTTGPNAVEDIESARTDAQRLLARAQYEQMKRLQTLGYEIDVDTFETGSGVYEDHETFWYSFGARQTRGLWERIRWAISL